MYAPFFGLQHPPFSIAPDPRYLFMSERHREALAHLLYGLDAGGGFVLLTGEIGTGKTTVCRCFLEQVPANCNVAYIFNPRLTAIEMLRTVCEEFRLPAPAPDASVKDLVDRYYWGVTRYTTSNFLRMKLGDALAQRGLAPHIYESAEEAHHHLRDFGPGKPG